MKETDFKGFIMPGFILILIILVFLILKDYLVAIFFGLILAYLFNPAHKIVKKLIREKNLSSFIVVILVLVILLIPLWLLVPSIINQIFDAYTFIQKLDVGSFIIQLFPGAQNQANLIAAANNFIGKTINALLNSFSDFLLNIPKLFINVAITLFIFFFSLRDSEKLKDYIKEISPFNEEVEKKLSSQFKDMTNAVLFGYMVVGLIQGLLTGLGLLIFGVPQTLLLTILAVFLAVIPFLGAWLIWVPAALYLFLTGNIGMGIGLTLYGAILVSWIDNIIKPYLVSKRTKVHSAVIFVGIIGGLAFFGIVGIILGPLILSYLLILIEIYKKNKIVCE